MGRLRSEEAHRRALEAASEVVSERGLEGLTVDEVSVRSGVAKTTIYRHWPSRAPLLIDAFHSSVEKGDHVPTGDVRADLLAIACGLAAKLRDPQWSRIMATLIDAAESDPELSELSAAFTRERREAVRAVLERGIADGELDPDIDTELAAQLVGGAIFYQRLIRRRAADDREVETMIDLVLNGLRR